MLNNDIKNKKNIITFKTSFWEMRVASFIMVFIYILLSDSFWTYTWENRILYNTNQILYLVLALISFGIVIPRISKNRIIDCLIPILSILGLVLCIVLNENFNGGYAVKASFIIIGLLFSICGDFDIFVNYYIRILKFIAVWSLVIYIMKLLGIINLLPIVKNIAGTELYNGIFSFISVHGDTLARNWGPFWEPGAFIVYLSFALILDLFYLKNKKPHNLILFSITIASTLSTTGILSLAIIYITYCLFTENTAKNINKYIILVAFVVGIIALFTSDKLYYMVLSKFEGDLSQSSSFGARYYSIIANLYISVHQGFFIGTGIENYNQIYKDVVINMGYNVDFSNTNTFLVDLGRFGWILGICNFIIFYKLAKRITNTISQTICIFIVLLLLLFMENMSFSFFWMTIPYLAMSKRNTKQVPLSINQRFLEV